jgi:ABC-type lipoprotein release transport system permease subunit
MGLPAVPFRNFSGLGGQRWSQGLIVETLQRDLTAGVRPALIAVSGAVVLLVGMVSAIACVLPAWRAVRIDPAEVLRAE